MTEGGGWFRNRRFGLVVGAKMGPRIREDKDGDSAFFVVKRDGGQMMWRVDRPDLVLEIIQTS